MCLNCKLRDGRASFLYSFNYCEETDLCLADEWNYINAWCPTKWIPGWQLDIDADCASKVEIGKCLPVVSSKDMAPFTQEYSLVKGGQCSIDVDATKAMARLSFTKASQIGVLFNAYLINEPVTIEKGENQQITVYNGDLNMPATFTIAISGAQALAVALTGAAAVTSSLF